MKLSRLFAGLAALALAALGTVAIAAPPTVSSIHPGSDYVQIIPNGSPQVGNVYATVSQLLGGSTNASGLSGNALPLTNFKTGAGVGMAASAAANVFGVSATAGTSLYLVSEAANNNTKTDTAGIEIVLPASYVAGTNITVTASTVYIPGAGTVGTHTLGAAAYLTAADGSQGSTLIATSAQTIPATTAGNVTFTITGTGLVPGSRIWLTLTATIQETAAGGNITARVNSVSLS